MKRSDLDRRGFLGASAGATAAVTMASATAVRAANRASRKVVVGVMGLSRGRALALGMSKLEDVEVKYTCDVDQARADSGAKSLAATGVPAPQAITDFRAMLEDKSVDVLMCAAPNHWHAPATIMACAHGKHVYVEKPCSHNPWEGETMVAAARKHKRCVQMGSQRRSGEKFKEAAQRLAEGVIGRVYEARCWYDSLRGPTGTCEPADVPPHFDYELWQGPAPRMPYATNRVPYKWHWFWHWGNGELGNNGVHTLDLCRWGLQADYPVEVCSSGGRWQFDDDQETPDTQTVSFIFEGGKAITWQGHSCNKHGNFKGPQGGDARGFITFYGDKGTLELDDRGYRVYDLQSDKMIDEGKGASRGDNEHFVNFVECIRNDDAMALNAEIETGHKSTLLCHLGNIAHRTGSTLHCNPQDGHILHNEDAQKLWKREYEPGWEPTF